MHGGPKGVKTRKGPLKQTWRVQTLVKVCLKGVSEVATLVKVGLKGVNEVGTLVKVGLKGVRGLNPRKG